MAELPGLVVELALVEGAGRRLVDGMGVFTRLGGERILRLTGSDVVFIGLAEGRAGAQIKRATTHGRDQRGRKQIAFHYISLPWAQGPLPKAAANQEASRWSNRRLACSRPQYGAARHGFVE